MDGICSHCQRHPKGPLKCTNSNRLTNAKCRRCRDNGLDCVDVNISIVETPFFQTPRSRRSSVVVRRSTPRRRHLRPTRVSTVNSTFDVESIERAQRALARPSQDSLAGNIRKILISLDVGSGNIKAAWKPVFDSRGQHALVDRLMHGCRLVLWNNLQAHCPAQVAFKLVRSEGGWWEICQIWGYDVDHELERGSIGESDVLRWVKPVIFNYDDFNSMEFHKGQFKERLHRLQKKAKELNISEDEWRDIDETSVYSDLLRHAFQFVCEQILEEFPQLRPHLATHGQDLQMSSRGLDVEVALPVPAGSLPKHVKIVLDAAKKAGLPCPFPVAEPSAAIVYYLQEQMETSTDQSIPDEQTVLLLDAGEGSLDAILCSVIAEARPDSIDEALHGTPNRRHFVLREEVAGLTEWAGGSFANQACQQWLETTFAAEFDEMLRDPTQWEHYKTRSCIIDQLVRDFEKKKKRFSGCSLAYGDEVRLMLHGFPPRRTNANAGGYITIDKVTMMGFLKKQLDVSLSLIQQQMNHFQQKESEAGSFRPIEQIILVGGANESRYMRETIKRHLSQIARLELDGCTNVRLPQVTRLNTLTAQGSLLLLQDKAFIGDRVLRRGYCVKWDCPTFLRKSTRDFVIEKDSEDGVMCKKHVSKFLLHAGDRVGYRHSVSMREGWRGLCMEPADDDSGFDHDQDCFLIDEHFFFCDKACQDGLNVYYKPNGIHEVGMVTFRLDRERCRDFVETYEYNGKRYWYVQYEVRIEIEGLDFKYTMVIPEGGAFDGDAQDSYGRHPIVAEGSLTWEDEGGLCMV